MPTGLVGFRLVMMSRQPQPVGEAPKPIDPRGPRFNQTCIAVVLLVGFVADWPVAVPAIAVVLASGAVLGPRFGPFLAFYARVIRPRLGPPAELEDPRPPRFSAAFGALVLVGSTAALVGGHADLGWVLALAVAVLAGLSAGTGICVGCEIYLLVARLRGLRGPRPPGVGSRRTRPAEREHTTT